MGRWIYIFSKSLAITESNDMGRYELGSSQDFIWFKYHDYFGQFPLLRYILESQKRIAQVG